MTSTDQPRDPETGQFLPKRDKREAYDEHGDHVEVTGEAAGAGGDGEYELVAERVDRTMRQTLAALLGENIGGKDDDFSYYDVFEWDKNPGVDQFYALALRNPYAFAVTFLPASTAWRDPPEIVDDAEGASADGQTTFEKEVETLVREQKLWHYGKRADKLAGIGRYGVLVLQFDDVEKPADLKKPVGEVSKLTGLRPFSEKSIDEIELGGPASNRWGHPVRYKLDLSDENDSEDDATTKGPDEVWVHHTRVVHIHSDELLDDEVHGVPRQQPVYNNLIDIEKTLGSAGTLAYRASAWGINVNIDKDYDVEDNGDGLREALQRWQMGLENVLRTHGAKDVKSLGGEEIDPSGVIDPNIEAISAYLKLPQSVLKGNETGERATSEDLKEWYGVIQERRQEFVEPTIVRPVIDKLVELEILPAPKAGTSGYEVEWKPLQETSEEDEANIQKTRAETLIEWTGNPDDYLTREQQKEFIETGALPSEMEEIEELEVDESDPAVQEQFSGGGTGEDGTEAEE